MRKLSRSRWLILALVAIVPLVALPATATAKPRDPISVQIIGLNDFHGQLEVVGATASSGGRIGGLSAGACTPPSCIPAGDVEYLATHLDNLRAENRKTVFVSAGDLIGATPLLSALFHDEPTIEAFNEMDLDYNGVGNHEFDEGIQELLRMQYGNMRGPEYRPARRDGCHPVDACGDGDRFRGADFDFLAANVQYRDSGATIFPPYAIHRFPGSNAKVAFVGMTLEGTPLIVSPDGIADVRFLDEAQTVNALVPELRNRGVEAIVVLLHEGGSVSDPLNPSTINNCNNPTGALPPIVEAMDDAVDIVITGHTNWAVNCVIDGKIVTGAASQGRLLTDIDAQIDWDTGDFIKSAITVNNRIVTQDVPKDPAMTALIAEYNEFAAPIAAEVVGNTTAPLTRAPTLAGESTLGRLIADAQLASTQDIAEPGQIAFMNPGGIRADLDAGPITYGEAFSVQPFSNIVTTKTFTGAQIDEILEQQFVTSAGGSRQLILQVSNGFAYTWNAANPVGSRVDPATITLNGVPIDPAASYRVTMNNFLGAGGDDFPALRQGTNETAGDDDLVALVEYLDVNDPYTPVETPRITRVP